MFRASLSGLLMNCIIMGWVIRAMVKVAGQLFSWQDAAPGLYDFVAGFWPVSSALGTPSEGITIFLLIGMVALYSSMGGLRAVVITDFFQFFIAIAGSAYLAVKVWQASGGQDGIVEKLSSLYGADHHYLDLFPSTDSSWLANLEMGLGFFGLYLVAQGVARDDSGDCFRFEPAIDGCPDQAG